MLRFREPGRHGRVRGHGEPCWVPGRGVAQLCRLACGYGGEGGKFEGEEEGKREEGEGGGEAEAVGEGEPVNNFVFVDLLFGPCFWTICYYYNFYSLFFFTVYLPSLIVSVLNEGRFLFLLHGIASLDPIFRGKLSTD